MNWYLDPIFGKNGGYPQIMVDQVKLLFSVDFLQLIIEFEFQVDKNSLNEKRKWSRLPKMSVELQNYIKGTSDFLGLNYYAGLTVKSKNSSGMEGSFRKDIELEFGVDLSWKKLTPTSSWLFLIPGGIRECLKWVKKIYGDIPVLITENGWSDNGELEDNDRINYLHVNYVDVAKAINEDGCNVIGHTVWSIIDNFEWLQGYS